MNTTAPSLSNLAGDLHELDTQLLHPIRLNHGRTNLVAGVDYMFTYYKLTGVQDANQPTNEANQHVTVNAVPPTLHALSAILGINQRLAPRGSANVGGRFRAFVHRVHLSTSRGDRADEQRRLQVDGCLHAVLQSRAAPPLPPSVTRCPRADGTSSLPSPS